ncbi:MAG TPA: hypothetical protein PLH63_00100, partial [Candidatus Cloacimonadota bacterium]|nr:hypothetical protein [Candidatus Cloacimonadota bacterium]
MSIKKVYQFKYIRNTNRLEPYKVDIASNLLITQQSIGVDNLILLFEQNYDSVNSEVLSLLKEYPKNHIIEFYLGDDKRLYITDYISKNPIKVVKNNIGELCYESTGNIVKKEIIENNDLEIKDDFIVVKNKVEIIKENVGVKVKNTKDYKAIIKELKTKNERLTQDNKNLHYELQNLDKQFIKLQVEKKTIEDQKQEILKTKR